MEATQTELKPVLYFRDAEAENRMRANVASAARALNDLYTRFKFSELSEIPLQVEDWKIKRTLEVNPSLAERAKVFKLESLNYEVPQWIQDIAQAFSHWHATKAQHTQYMQYMKQEGEAFIVDQEKLNLEFEKPTYKKYFDKPEQLARLQTCKNVINALIAAGITYPYKYIEVFKHNGNPWLRVIGDKYIPCLEFVLNGEIYPGAPLQKSPGYILESVLD